MSELKEKQGVGMEGVVSGDGAVVNRKFQFVVSAEYDLQDSGRHHGLLTLSLCDVDLQDNESKTVTKITTAGKWGHKFAPIYVTEFKEKVLEGIGIALEDHFLTDKASK